MKKLMIFTAVLAFSAAGYAQDAKQAVADAAAAISSAPVAEAPVKKISYWTTSAAFDLGFNQTAIFNWAAGGYNSISLAASIDAKADYARDLTSWKNRLQMNYGFLWSADKKNLLQKSSDRIYLESKWAYRTSEKSKWSYSAGLDMRTQFSNTYDNYKNLDAEGKEVPWYGDLKSGFLSPAYVNLALGLDWKPADWFNMSLSPVTGGLTIVDDPNLRKSYGMKLVEGTETYRPVLFQFGAQLKAGVNVAINDVFTFESQVVGFYDYLYDYKANGGVFPVRVNWDNKIGWQLTKLFKIGLDTWLIYDPLIKNGDEVRGVQFKEFLSINFTYTIANKKK